MVLQRFDPLRDLRNMEEAVNRLWRGYGVNAQPAEDWNIAIDVVQKPDEIVVNASLPGVKPEDIDVTIEDNVLTLKAARQAEHKEEDSRYLIQERSYGSYYRALRLPDTVDLNKVKSAYDHGVLSITLPRAEEKKPKQIKVNVGAKKEIEAGAAKTAPKNASKKK
jgi:HSP20 family protein